MQFLENISFRKILFVHVIIIGLTLPALAQPSGDDLGEVDDQAVPIDGGLTLALAAGAGYLVKRRHDARKKKADKDKQILP